MGSSGSLMHAPRKNFYARTRKDARTHVREYDSDTCTSQALPGQSPPAPPLPSPVFHLVVEVAVNVTVDAINCPHWEEIIGVPAMSTRMTTGGRVLDEKAESSKRSLSLSLLSRASSHGSKFKFR